jgi:curved DNA-binding protein CbpA
LTKFSPGIRPTMDYYSLLGVHPSASKTTIHEAYKKLALELHPDRNKNQFATAAFQRLSAAWEILREDGRRREYDAWLFELGGGRGDDSLRAEEKKNESRRRNWRSDGWEVVLEDASTGTGRDEGKMFDEAEYALKVRDWKSMAREDYISRLESWKAEQKAQLGRIVASLRALQKRRLKLETGWREDEGSGVGRSSDMIQDMGRRFAEQVFELESIRKRYEEHEARIRQQRIKEALSLLRRCPSAFNTLSVKGPKLQAWRSLSRVKPSISLRYAFKAARGDESPWHELGEWERLAGEYVCERCSVECFQVLDIFGMARCPGCEALVCDRCWRDLKALRGYEVWLMAGESRDIEDILSDPYL